MQKVSFSDYLQQDTQGKGSCKLKCFAVLQVLCTSSPSRNQLPQEEVRAHKPAKAEEEAQVEHQPNWSEEVCNTLNTQTLSRWSALLSCQEKQSNRICCLWSSSNVLLSTGAQPFPENDMHHAVDL